MVCAGVPSDGPAYLRPPHTHMEANPKLGPCYDVLLQHQPRIRNAQYD
jgi:hypothetical protein